jgi:hypothetical protein
MKRRDAILSLLLIAVTLAFVQADSLTGARSRVYTEARRSADMLEEDLLKCFPFTGAREFTVDDRAGSRRGSDKSGELSFMATTLVGTTHQVARVTYYLTPDGKSQRSAGTLR